MLVSLQTALMVAPGSIAPVSSLTVPVMSPVVFCAKVVDAKANARKTPMAVVALGRSISPPRFNRKTCRWGVVNRLSRAVKHSYARSRGKSAAIRRNEAAGGGRDRDDGGSIRPECPACSDHRFRGAAIFQDRRSG